MTSKRVDTAATPQRSDRQPGSARRRRRKEARPAEIIEAAIEVFSEHGFGASKLEDVARRAGVAKGTLFVYFQSKEDLFKAAVRTVLADHLDGLQRLSNDPDRPLAVLVEELLAQAADSESSRIPQMMRLLIGESRTFPDLIRMWHSEVASHAFSLMTVAIERAQARKEIRPGNALLHAFSILGPLITATLFREVFQNTDANLPELHDLARQHTETILHGLVIGDGRDESAKRKR